MKFIVAPRNYHKTLLSRFRLNDSFFEVKFFTKHDLEHLVFPQFDDSALIYLITQKHYSYELSRKMLMYLPFCKGAKGTYKLNQLSNLYNELESAGFVIKEMKNAQIIGKNVEIYGYSEQDIELISLLKLLKLEYSFIKNSSFENRFNVEKYGRVEEETIIILNKIASLIDKGVSPSDIYIFNRNEEYDYYLSKFSPMFGFHINGIKKDKWSTTGVYANFIKIYRENKNIEQSLILLKEIMKEDDLYSPFDELIRNCVHNELNFEQQLEFISAIAKRTSMTKTIYSNSIELITEPTFLINKYVFIIGFAQSFFPRASKDNNYLNDDELTSINRLNSIQQTNIDFDVLTDFLKSQNNVNVSYSATSLSTEYYPSPLVNTLDLDVVMSKFPNTFYSKSALSYIYASMCDLAYIYKEESNTYLKIKKSINIPYNNYDNSVKDKIDVYKNTDKLYLSTTALDKYSKCPYSYYLAKILKLDDDTNFNTAVGTICHSIMESFYDENFDFDTKFDKEISNFEFNYAELFALKDVIKEQLIEALETIKQRNSHTLNPKFFTEKELKYEIGKNTYVIGRVDLTEIINDELVVCIDYKTGSYKFDEKKLQYGLYSQLPTYMLLYLSDPSYSKYKLSGIYINQIISNKYKDEIEEGELIKDYLKLNGKTLSDYDSIAKMDDTISSGKSKFYSTISLKDENRLKDTKNLISQEEFIKYKDDVKELYINMAANLYKNNFDISPIFFKKDDSNNGCTYCRFKDICYIRKNQMRQIVDEEQNDE